METGHLPKPIGKMILEFLNLCQTEGIDGNLLPSELVKDFIGLMFEDENIGAIVRLSFLIGWEAHEKYGQEPPKMATHVARVSVVENVAPCKNCEAIKEYLKTQILCNDCTRQINSKRCKGCVQHTFAMTKFEPKETKP